MNNEDKECIPPLIQKEIKKIKLDSINSSTLLTEKGIKIIDEYLQICKKFGSFSKETLQQIILSLVEAQPSMALLLDFANQLLIHLNSSDQSKEPVKNQIASLIMVVQKYKQSLKKAESMIVYHASKELTLLTPIATYSSSKTVEKTIKMLSGNNTNLQVICSESRPKNEGVSLAKNLAKNNISVSLMTDASLFSHLENVKTILIGADSITKNGVVNKIGSKSLILLANHYDLNIYCLCSSHKQLPYQYHLREESKKPSTDILHKKQKKINVINYYFDTTPLDLFTGIITEDGLFSHDEIIDQLHKKTIHSILKN
jgi:translation initiation factor eIF-2B subunit delta